MYLTMKWLFTQIHSAKIHAKWTPSLSLATEGFQVSFCQAYLGYEDESQLRLRLRHVCDGLVSGQERLRVVASRGKVRAEDLSQRLGLTNEPVENDQRLGLLADNHLRTERLEETRHQILDGWALQHKAYVYQKFGKVSLKILVCTVVFYYG